MRKSIFVLAITLILTVVVANAQPVTGPSSEEMISRISGSVIIFLARSSGSKLKVVGSGFLIAPNIVATSSGPFTDGVGVIAMGPSKGDTLEIEGFTAKDSPKSLILLKVRDQFRSTPELKTATGVQTGEEVLVVGQMNELQPSHIKGKISVVDSNGEIQLAAALSQSFIGAPVLNTQGLLVGLVTGASEKGQVKVAPASLLGHLLAKSGSDAFAKLPYCGTAVRGPNAGAGPAMQRVSGGVLQGSAIKKVQPPYPRNAIGAHVQGAVKVQIIVAEEGCVMAAKVVDGPSKLREAALAAAVQWTFRKTELSGVPVKIEGILTFNFNLQ